MREPERGGGCFKSVQKAVDAASPGERIDIYPGTYQGVDINTKGLKLIGMGRNPGAVTLDGLGSGDTVDVTADGVTLTMLRVINGGSNCIDVTADGFRLHNASVSGCSSDCLELDGDGALVTNSRLTKCNSDGIDVDGDRFRLVRSLVRQTNSECVEISGDDAVAWGNRINTCEDSEGIDIDGRRGLVTGNYLFGTDGDFINVNGSRPRVTNNRGEGVDDDGIEVDGRNPVVTNNSMQYAEGDNFNVDCTNCTGGLVANNFARGGLNDDEGYVIDADAKGLVVRDNLGRNLLEEGFDVSGTGVELLDNVALFAGAELEEGFDVSGQGHLLQGNIARSSSGDGFEISGGDHKVVANTAVNNVHSGFQLEGDSDGILLDGNVAQLNMDYGINISSSDLDGTRVFRNFARRNSLADYCDMGTGTMKGTGAMRNRFGTVCP